MARSDIVTIRVPLGNVLWRSSDRIGDHRVLAEFMVPLYFSDSVPEERHERIIAGMEFQFRTMRVGKKAFRVRLVATATTIEHKQLFDAEIGGYEADYCYLSDRVDVAVIGLARGLIDHVILEFSHGQRDVRRPAREEQLAEALHNARAFVRLYAGQDAAMVACLRELDGALDLIPPRYHPKQN
jgi:hypothetical protein